MSLQVVWESRWALPGDHISAADVRCRIPLCFLPWKTPSTSRLDPLHHGHIAACHNAVQEQQPLKSQPQTCSGLFSFSLAGKRQKKKYVAAKSILPSSSFPETEQRRCLPAGISKYTTPVPWHRCGWELTLQLGCPSPGPWVHWTYPETRKGVGKKPFHFFKVPAFLNIWIVSPGFLPPSNTCYCKENFGSRGRKEKSLSNGQYGPGKKDVSTSSTPTAVWQAWEFLIAGKQNTNCLYNCFYQVALSFS